MPDPSTWSEYEIRQTAWRFLNASSPEPIAMEQIRQVDHWRPVYFISTGGVTAHYSYQSGYTDERYTQAKRRYQEEMLAYNAAYNQYVNAKNQVEHIRNQQAHLPAHKRSYTTYPVAPSEPVAPRAEDYVVWAERKQGQIRASKTQQAWGHGSDLYAGFLRLLKTQSYQLDLFGLDKKEKFSSFWIPLYFHETDASSWAEQVEEIAAQLQKSLNGLALQEAHKALEHTYHRDVQLTSTQTQSLQIKAYTDYFLLVNYIHQDRSMNLIMHPRLGLINAELPTNWGRWWRYVVTQVLALLLCFLFSNITLSTEDYSLRLTYALSSYAGLNILAYTLELSDMRPRWLQALLQKLSWRNWGFRRQREVNVSLSAYR